MLTTLTSTVPSWVSGLDFSEITAAASEMAAKVSVPILAVLVPTICIKLLKKFGNKIG